MSKKPTSTSATIFKGRSRRLLVLILAALVTLTTFFVPSISSAGSRYEFLPSRRGRDWPKKIWYKLGPSGLREDLRAYIDTCVTNNTDYQVKFVTDAVGDAFVAEAFAHDPRLVESYLNLTVPILKADLLRYMLLYDQGGVWSDLDVSCSTIPMSQWIPEGYKKNSSLVVGLEFDNYDTLRQFASWTIMAKPGSPHLMRIVHDAFDRIREIAYKNKVEIGKLTKDMVGDIIGVTGPERVTLSVIKSLEHSLNTTIPMSAISFVEEPRQIGDVVILPEWSFAASMVEDQTRKAKPTYVVHHYAGSWKNSDGGEKKEQLEMRRDQFG